MAIDPTGGRKDALEAFVGAKLRECFVIETHPDTSILILPGALIRGRDGNELSPEHLPARRDVLGRERCDRPYRTGHARGCAGEAMDLDEA